MSKSDIHSIVRQASVLIDQGKIDQAIDLLRVPQSNANAELAALLAEAYFRRGDTKGDVYSSYFFAERTRELGQDTRAMRVIQAISAFRKANYLETVGLMSADIDDSSPPANRYIYGLALLYSGKHCDALKLFEPLVREYPDIAEYADAAEQAREGIVAPIELPELPSPSLGGVDDVRPDAVDSPYKFNAVSKLRGLGRTAKDMYWLAKNIPCQEACPAKTDIPAYLTEIYEGNYDQAYRINLRDNVFPAVLGRVCARPCEPECRHGWDGLGDSVAICFSKRSAADFQSKSDPVILDPLFPPSGKKIAVIGAGVAGLAAARDLALFGHRVTVYEKHLRPGGMLNQGIPTFRLPREVIDREVEQIRQQGVEIICNTAIGRDLAVEQLLLENDAVVLAAGTLRPNLLDLPGKELSGIRHGLDFLLEANEKGDTEIGEHVIVIGGGFTAMDCARTAARLGAKLSMFEAEDRPWSEKSILETGSSVRVLYRRSVNEMLVTPGELEELQHEKIDMEFLISPLAYIGDQGKLCAVRFIKNKLGEPDASGRRRPMPIAGSEFDVPADLVLLATGQFPDTEFVDQSLRSKLVGDDQWLLSGSEHCTNHPQVFVAGDFATGAQSLIDAIGHARNCARAVDSAVMGTERLEDVAVIEDVCETGRIREMDLVELQAMPTLSLENRSLEAEVETGYSKDLAVEETQRCYRCHLKFEIDSDKCIYCDWCIKVKPRPDCIVKVTELIYGDKEQIVGFHRAKGSEDTKLIYINQEDCIRCGACVDACPVDCISIQKVSLATRSCGGA